MRSRYSKQSRNTQIINPYAEPINYVDLHIFGDANILGCCAVAYEVVSQPWKVNQGLVASKSRLSRK